MQKRNKSIIAELQHITRKRFIPTTQFGMLNFLTQKQSID
ncbi:transposase [Streptococcus pneumoniae GA18523]|nr:transposase [Streptococcus pneumoniae Taiwan19F-14]EHD49928.1 transposase [Streptococcus pneumoniae 7286-06]EHD70386.1 transposase [Streptococcus pneumoniae GA18523]EHD93701.1 transposase [Streptococcus pneumoniae GA14798]EHD96189.1 transposase [Streptococcus pneumoniae GA16121]EHE08409.1 transposase [Streptococcus pneumoniae GA17371]EHE14752.1 transposase [Streptococcus pneumoniae GA19451]EHE57996.1 transposase [Streptococcus pneumoniae 5185-06]EHZ09184.1 transposase [Streptococcus pneu